MNMRNVNYWTGLSSKHLRRSARGQAIAEGAAMMPVIIGLSICMIVLLFFVGTTFYYWMQLSSAATQLATYLSTRVSSTQTSLTAAQRTDLEAKANTLLAYLKLPAVTTSTGGQGAAVTLATNLTNIPALNVTLTLSGIKSIGGMIPTFPIVGSGVAIASTYEPAFKHYAAISFTDVGAPNGIHHGITMYVPCYEAAAFGDWGTTLGSVPAGMTEIGNGGVNAVYESAPRNTWGGSY